MLWLVSAYGKTVVLLVFLMCRYIVSIYVLKDWFKSLFFGVFFIQAIYWISKAKSFLLAYLRLFLFDQLFSQTFGLKFMIAFLKRFCFLYCREAISKKMMRNFENSLTFSFWCCIQDSFVKLCFSFLFFRNYTLEIFSVNHWLRCFEKGLTGDSFHRKYYL